MEHFLNNNKKTIYIKKYNMRYNIGNFRTCLLLILVRFLITIANECPVDESVDKLCSGQGTKWNTSTQSCDCGQHLWGKHCEFGRQRLTSKSGYFVESHGKYHCHSKYMYLIESGRKNIPIQIKLHQFATECNWDYLYIFDGRSIYDPLIASYSGLIKKNIGLRHVNTTNLKAVTARSGAAYMYFYSDALINDLGFNVSYIISNCSNEQCGGHGICIQPGICQCSEGWTGHNCTKRLCCREVCSLHDKTCNRDCTVCKDNFQVAPRASHAAAVTGSKMWVYSGYSFDKDIDSINKLMLFDLNTQEWSKAVDPPLALDRRFGHTMIFYGGNLFIFGGNKGSITNEMWKYQINRNSWEQLKAKGQQPVAVTGHASVVIGSSMFTFFGFNKDLLYVKHVQKYDLDRNRWSIVKTKGGIVHGRFGHSASYDVKLRTVFVFGGFYDKILDSKLLLFHVPESEWSVSDALTMPRMLHAAGIIGRNLIIYGGNGHKTNNADPGDSNRCFSSSLMVYNIDCKHSVKLPVDHSGRKNLLEGKERYGHSAVIYNRAMHIFGGFDGTFKSDVFQIKISGKCDTPEMQTKEQCLSTIIAGCMWDTSAATGGKCITGNTLHPASSVNRPNCQTPKNTCYKIKKGCVECTNHKCEWQVKERKCAKRDTDNVHFQTGSQAKKITDPHKCENAMEEICKLNSGCVACHKQANCSWKFGEQACKKTKPDEYTEEKRCFYGNVTSCEDITQCKSCIKVQSNQCMWCESRKQCLHAQSYKVSNPYGQCLEWISANQYMNVNQDCKAVTCQDQGSCKKCLQIAGCGWCEDKSGTGLGACMKGGDDSPIANKTCTPNLWHFMKCPACYCNGHSQCIKNTDICEICHGNVEGKHCDRCRHGYYGNPGNNGTCEKCTCNKHFAGCSSTGKCDCSLLGAIGDHCERCDLQQYFGNASNGGMCYKNLTVNYEYTKNFSGKNNVAAFRAVPLKKEKQIDFKIERMSGSKQAMLNISIYYEALGKSTVVKQNLVLGKYQRVFSESDYDESPGEIRAVIWGWSKDEYFRFKITVQKSPPFNLIYFLIMFLVCFCSLLIILIVLWKIKQRYDIFIHNRQQRHEHAERISRPFRTISIFLHEKISSYQKVPPSLVVCEQFSTGNLAVASVIIELPRAGNGYSPTDHSGICIGSTLVTTPQRWTFTQMQQKYGCDRRRRKNVERAVAV